MSTAGTPDASHRAVAGKKYPALAQLTDPSRLQAMPAARLGALANEIRDFLIEKVSVNGGHLGPNLGAVELTIAIHRVFDSPSDPVLFDTGHQAYVHKVLTGRAAGFDRLRQRDGLAGYPNRGESPHDVIENSHASTALSYADGLAKAFALRGEKRHVVAVVGDGALTGGMCWEALNNIAAGTDRPVIIVVNDNGKSYSPTIGGLADQLATLRLNPGYEKALQLVRETLDRSPKLGAPLFEVLHGMKRGIKDTLAPQGLFEDLGLKYVGPIDGHDIAAMESALRRAKEFGGPVIVHAATRKGYGYSPAEADESGSWHSHGAYDLANGEFLAKVGTSWTSVFAQELVSIAESRSDVVGITAAMPGPTGVSALAERFPERAYDVGIAEQHAVTSAAGLAMGGFHPVVALYATFLNRAFDQTLLDVGLHGCGVTFALDRAGITGPDGPSHYGIWDFAILGLVPGMRVAAPRDEATMREELREAVAISDGPTSVRYPPGAIGAPLPALQRLGTGTDSVDVLVSSDDQDVLLVGVGAFAGMAVDIAARVAEQGIGVSVVDPRWVLPVSPELVELARNYRLVVTLEDGIRAGGIGTAITTALRDAGVAAAVRDEAVPAGYHPHGSRSEVLAGLGLTVQDISRDITEWVAGLDDTGDRVEAAIPPSSGARTRPHRPLGEDSPRS